jgi:hypothetical protein
MTLQDLIDQHDAAASGDQEGYYRLYCRILDVLGRRDDNGLLIWPHSATDSKGRLWVVVMGMEGYEVHCVQPADAVPASSIPAPLTPHPHAR